MRWMDLKGYRPPAEYLRRDEPEPGKKEEDFSLLDALSAGVGTAEEHFGALTGMENFANEGRAIKERNLHQYEDNSIPYHLQNIFVALPESAGIMAASTAAGIPLGGALGAAGGFARGALTQVPRVSGLLWDLAKAYQGAGTASKIARAVIPQNAKIATSAELGAAMEAGIEGYEAERRFIDLAKRNGTYVQGQTEQQARDVRDNVFWDNMGIISAFNIPQYNLLMGRPARGLLSNIGRTVASGFGEGTEEVAQELASAYELGVTPQWRDIRDSFIAGGVLGTGMHGAGTAARYGYDRLTGAPTTAEIEEALNARKERLKEYSDRVGSVTVNDDGTAAYDNTPYGDIRQTVRDSAENRARQSVHGIDSFMRAISGQESGGNYDAVNPDSGASGAFQIMPDNWSAWAQDAGLSPDAPMTPENQELVARNKMLEYYNKFGNWRDVAIAWYAGEGEVTNPSYDHDAPQGEYPSVNSYADSVMSRFQEQGGEESSGRARGGNIFGVENYDMPTQGDNITQQVSQLKDGWSGVIPQIGGVLKEKFGLNATISSAARSADHNAEVGGAPNSYHIVRDEGGDALDIVFDRDTTQEEQDRIADYFKGTGLFSEVLYHDVGSGAHLHLGGLKTENLSRGVQFDSRTLTRPSETRRTQHNQLSQEETPKPLFDLNAEDEQTQKLLERFANERIQSEVNAENPDRGTLGFFTGLFNEAGEFQNTEANRAALRERYGKGITSWANEILKQESPAQPAAPARTQSSTPRQGAPKVTNEDILASVDNFLERLRTDRTNPNTLLELQEARRAGDVAKMESILRQNNVEIAPVESTAPVAPSPQPPVQSENVVQNNQPPENILTSEQETAQPQQETKPATPKTQSAQTKTELTHINRVSKATNLANKNKKALENIVNSIQWLAAQNNIAIPVEDLTKLQKRSLKTISRWRDKLTEAGALTVKPVQETTTAPPAPQKTTQQPPVETTTSTTAPLQAALRRAREIIDTQRQQEEQAQRQQEEQALRERQEAAEAEVRRKSEENYNRIVQEKAERERQEAREREIKKSSAIGEKYYGNQITAPEANEADFRIATAPISTESRAARAEQGRALLRVFYSAPSRDVQLPAGLEQSLERGDTKAIETAQGLLEQRDLADRRRSDTRAGQADEQALIAQEEDIARRAAQSQRAFENAQQGLMEGTAESVQNQRNPEPREETREDTQENVTRQEQPAQEDDRDVFDLLPESDELNDVESTERTEQRPPREIPQTAPQQVESTQETQSESQSETPAQIEPPKPKAKRSKKAAALHKKFKTDTHPNIGAYLDDLIETAKSTDPVFKYMRQRALNELKQYESMAPPTDEQLARVEAIQGIRAWIEEGRHMPVHEVATAIRNRLISGEISIEQAQQQIEELKKLEPELRNKLNEARKLARERDGYFSDVGLMMEQEADLSKQFLEQKDDTVEKTDDKPETQSEPQPQQSKPKQKRSTSRKNLGEELREKIKPDTHPHLKSLLDNLIKKAATPEGKAERAHLKKVAEDLKWLEENNLLDVALDNAEENLKWSRERVISLIDRHINRDDISEELKLHLIEKAKASEREFFIFNYPPSKYFELRDKIEQMHDKKMQAEAKEKFKYFDTQFKKELPAIAELEQLFEQDNANQQSKKETEQSESKKKPTEAPAVEEKTAQDTEPEQTETQETTPESEENLSVKEILRKAGMNKPAYKGRFYVTAGKNTLEEKYGKFLVIISDNTQGLRYEALWRRVNSNKKILEKLFDKIKIVLELCHGKESPAVKESTFFFDSKEDAEKFVQALDIYFGNEETFDKWVPLVEAESLHGKDQLEEKARKHFNNENLSIEYDKTDDKDYLIDEATGEKLDYLVRKKNDLWQLGYYESETESKEPAETQDTSPASEEAKPESKPAEKETDEQQAIEELKAKTKSELEEILEADKYPSIQEYLDDSFKHLEYESLEAAQRERNAVLKDARKMKAENRVAKFAVERMFANWAQNRPPVGLTASGALVTNGFRFTGKDIPVAKKASAILGKMHNNETTPEAAREKLDEILSGRAQEKLDTQRAKIRQEKDRVVQETKTQLSEILDLDNHPALKEYIFKDIDQEANGSPANSSKKLKEWCDNLIAQAKGIRDKGEIEEWEERAKERLPKPQPKPQPDTQKTAPAREETKPKSKPKQKVDKGKWHTVGSSGSRENLQKLLQKNGFPFEIRDDGTILNTNDGRIFYDSIRINNGRWQYGYYDNLSSMEDRITDELKENPELAETIEQLGAQVVKERNRFYIAADAETLQKINDYLDAKENQKSDETGKADITGAPHIDTSNVVAEKDLTPAQKLLVSFGKKLGVEVVFFNNPDGRFRGVHKGGKTFLNINGNKELGGVFWHESFHWLKNNNPELYKALVKAAGITDAQRKAYLEKSKRKDLKSNDGIDEEILADMMDDVAKRTGLFQSIAGKNRGLIERVIQWLKDTLNKFIDHFRNPQGKLTTAQAQALASEFGRIANQLKDPNGNQIFRYNRRTHNVELADNRERTEAELAEMTAKNARFEAKYSVDSNDNSTKSFKQQVKNLLGIEGKNIPIHKQMKLQLEDLSDMKIAADHLPEGVQVKIDKIAKVIRTGREYDWANILPEVGNAVAEQLGITQSAEMGNYIGKFILNGAPNDESAEAKEFAKAMRENPEMYNKVMAIRGTFDKWNNMSAEEQMIASTRYDKEIPPLRERAQKFWQYLRTELFDTQMPIHYHVAKFVKATGVKLSESINPEIAFRNLRGMQQRAMRMVYGNENTREALQKMYPNVDFSNWKPIAMILESIKAEPGSQRYMLFDQFVKACHFLDIHKHNDNVLMQQGKVRGEIRNLRTELDKADTKKKKAELERSIKKKEESLEALKQKIMDTPDAYTKDKCADLVSKYSNEFGEAQRDIVQYSRVLLDIMADSGMISRRRYHQMLAAYPNYVPLHREFDENPNLNTADSMKQMLGSAKDIGDSIAAISNNTFDYIQRTEKNKAKLLLANLANFDGVGGIFELVDGSSPNDGTIIHFYENGKRKALQCSDEDIVKAVNSMNQPTMNLFLKVLQVPALMLRATATGLSPGFILGNFLRDPQDAFMVSKRYNAANSKELGKDFLNAFNPLVTGKYMLEAMHMGKLYEEYAVSGAAQSDFFSFDRDYKAEAIERLTKKNYKRFASPKGIIELLGKLGEWSELATRLRQYDKVKKSRAKEHGGINIYDDLVTAAFESRDFIDFARHGNAGRTWNTLTAFANPVLQGFDKQWRTYDFGKLKKFGGTEETQKEFYTSVARLFLGGVLPALVLSLLHKDDDWYKDDVQDWEKENYWILSEGLRVPKGADVGLRFFSNLTEHLISRDPVRADKVLQPLKGILPDLMPTAFLPIFECMANYDLFRRQPIVPQREVNKFKDTPELQYDSTNSKLAVLLGRVTGVSPRYIDHVIYGYTSGFGKEATHLIDTVTPGRHTAWARSDVPFFSRVLRTPYRAPKIVSEYYEEFGRQESYAQRLAWEKKHGNPNAKPSKEYDPALHRRLKNIQRAMQNLNAAERAIMDDPKLTSEQVEEKREEIQKKRVGLCRKAFQRAQ